jgi:hypothetical protein
MSGYSRTFLSSRLGGRPSADGEDIKDVMYDGENIDIRDASLTVRRLLACSKLSDMQVGMRQSGIGRKRPTDISPVAALVHALQPDCDDSRIIEEDLV